ncbi:phosphotriesterase [Salinisphaera sp. PC39]|uniref:phosphotriesterase family protein n=1 Tax=Salinisphaera sp. PC39 TaxID=1304156 RepID=UPI00333EEC65
MTTVETVRGPMDTSELGTTLMHEHVFVLSPEIQQNYPEIWDEEYRVSDAITKLKGLTEVGVDTIVDPTVIGLGRYIPRVQRIANEVDVNIVAATGVYTYNEVPFYFHFRGPDCLFEEPEPMTGMFIQDIREGIAGTSVKAAILKCVTEKEGLTPGVERVLRAVAQAHRETGVPITTHTDAHTERGYDQQKVFREEGVDLSRVIIGHCGDTTDQTYLRNLMDAGSTIGMDRFGLDILLDFENRVNTVVDLCKAGYADRMVLSHDTMCHIDWFTEEQRATNVPNWHYKHIHEDVLPALRERGVTEDQIDQMMVINPRRIFENVGAY